jgi:hypothetical protein
MPIDTYAGGDKPDAAPNTTTTPGKYIKIVVPDFSDTVAAVNPAKMAPTPLTSYLRLGAVEDVTKAGKATGTVGLVTDMDGNPLSVDLNAPFNPSYDPYAKFGTNNLPSDGKTPIPPATTPSSVLGNPPPGAPAYPAASGPDPTGEDLASLVQGFIDDTRNRGRPRMVIDPITGQHKPKKKPKHTPGGQPADPGTTAQGPLYGYPWVAPIAGAKAPGQLDADDLSTTVDPQYTKSSKPVFYPDDYRTLESSQLHTKGGWRDHTDGNRITTTRGDKVEVIRGNYKLLVLGRQDQTKPKFAGMDLSGGQADTGGGDLSADASTDFNQGSTAFSSLFEWRQCSTQALYDAAVKEAADPELHKRMVKDQKAADDAVKALNDATLAAQKVADPKGYLQATINAAQQMVLTASTAVPPGQVSSEVAIATAALGAAKKALLTAEQAVDPNLLQGFALQVLAATAPAGWSSADVTTWTSQAHAAAKAAWDAPASLPTAPLSVADAAAHAQKLDAKNAKSPSWKHAYAAWAAWTGTLVDATEADQLAVDKANTAALAAASTAATAAAAAAATAATGAQDAATTATGKAASTKTTADAADAAAKASPNDATLAAAAAAADVAAQTAAAKAAVAVAAVATMQAAAATAATEATAAAAAAAAATTTSSVTDTQAAAAAAPTAGLAAAVKNALAAWTGTINGVAVPPANALNAAALVAALAAQVAPAPAAAPALSASTSPVAQLGIPTSLPGAAVATVPGVHAPGGPGYRRSAIGDIAASDADLTTGASLSSAVLSALSPAWPGLDLTDAAAEAQAVAAYSTGLVEAALMEAGLIQAPIETLQLWEDEDTSPSDYRSISTTKKGSGPKVQVKFQAGGPDNTFKQDPGDGVTFATPISMGVSINETWSYQIYNYSGIGYYPTTAPQPWPPAPPKTQSQPLGVPKGKGHEHHKATLGGVALPAEAPDRDDDNVRDWPEPPQWVIYPVAKIVNKSYVVDQSSEVYAQQTVSVTAGPRTDLNILDPTQPKRTYPSDVASYLTKGGVPSPIPNVVPLYDRNLLTDANMQFPSTAELTAWILNASTSLTIGNYNKVHQAWTETHVNNQATILRANTTLSDTEVVSQNTKVHAGTSTTNTTVTGLQHAILNAGSTTSETTVGAQVSHTSATSIETRTMVELQSTMTFVGAQSAITVAGATSSVTVAPVISSLKAALLSIDLSVVLSTFTLHTGPQLEINPTVRTKTATEKAEMTALSTLLAGQSVTVGASHLHLAGIHILS